MFLKQIFSPTARPARARKFFRDSGANVAVIFGVALVPMLIAVGAGVDYAGTLNIKSKLQSALDSGLLSVAVDPTMVVGGSPGCANTTSCDNHAAAAVRDATRAYYANYRSLTPTVVTTNGSQPTIQATATVTMPTNVMKMFGTPNVTITVNSEVKRAGAGGVEVALVLDTTGSMAGAKLAGLKTAAGTLISTILPSASSPNKIGIATFDQYVNLPMTYRNASWLSGATDYSAPGAPSCTTTWSTVTYGTPQWISATCSNDGTPYDCSYWYTPETYSGTQTTTCTPTTDTYTWYGCVGSRNYPLDLTDTVSAVNPVPAMMNTSCGQPVTRLTSDPAALQAQISSLSAYGETYIAPGLLWGWRLLSPNAPFADGAAYGSKQKYIVLMTDGANTHSASYPGHGAWDVNDANSITAQTCSAIKAKGVKIFAVAFMVTDATIVNVLQNCATAPINYYSATSTSDLNAAFSSIASSIMTVRLSK